MSHINGIVRLTCLLAFGCTLSFAPATTQAFRQRSSGSARIVQHRIHFAYGAICAQSRGTLAHGQRETYLVRAKAGQHMIVHTFGLTRGFATLAIVTYPSGKQEGNKGIVNFDAKLPQTGDYRINVDINQMASEVYSGSFLLEVIVY